MCFFQGREGKEDRVSAHCGHLAQFFIRKGLDRQPQRGSEAPFWKPLAKQRGALCNFPRREEAVRLLPLPMVRLPGNKQLSSKKAQVHHMKGLVSSHFSFEPPKKAPSSPLLQVELKPKVPVRNVMWLKNRFLDPKCGHQRGPVDQ